MRTAIRGIIILLIVLWLGGVMFFPIVAATAFGNLSDVHAAGTVVGHWLRILHYEGIFSGALIIILLLIARAAGLRFSGIGITRVTCAVPCASM